MSADRQHLTHSQIIERLKAILAAPQGPAQDALFEAFLKTDAPKTCARICNGGTNHV